MHFFIYILLLWYFDSLTYANESKVCRKNAYYYGDLIKIFDDVSSANNCAKFCAVDEKCKSANYLKIRQKCELMENDPSTSPEDENVSADDNSDFISKTCSMTGSTSDGSITLLRPKRAGPVAQKCGQPTVMPRNASTRIVGGFEAKPHSFPWVVSIQQNGRHRCGASLIQTDGQSDQSQFALSATHCFFELYNEGLSVKFGANDLTAIESTVDVDVEEVFQHPQYDPMSVANDIALLKLAKPVKFTNYIKPVCLPMLNQNFKIGSLCTAAGWGATSESGSSATKLMQVELPLMDMKICNRTDWAYEGTLLKNEMICAGYEKGAKDACQGDSGGPLVIKQSNVGYVQLGIVSFGDGCAREKSPGIYTRVSNYVKWIKEKQKEALSATTTTTTTTTTPTTTKARRTTRRRPQWKPWQPYKPWWAAYNNWGHRPYGGK